MDHSLGRVLDWLDQKQLHEDTIVVFASDNGGLSAHARAGKKHTHNSPLKSGKGSAYEGGIRVPFAIRWPGRIKKDAINNLPIQLEDVMPTLCELVGTRQDCPDGTSFAPSLRLTDQQAHPLFFHHPHYWGAIGPGIEPFSAVRFGDLKLIWFYEPGRAELYDVVNDPGEQHDLATEQPAEVDHLRRILRAHLKTCDAQVPTRKNGQPVIRP